MNGFQNLESQARSIHLRGLDVEPTPGLVPGLEPDGGEGSACAAWFLQYGFSGVHDSDSAGWTPLHYAVLGGNVSIIGDLLNKKADVNRRTWFPQPQIGALPFMSALDICMLFKQNDAARQLLAAGAKITGGLAPPVISAAMSDNAEGVRLLRQHSSCLQALQKNVWGINAFEAACSCGSMSAVQELLNQDAALIDQPLLSGGLVFAGMSWGCSPALVAELVGLRADVNYQVKPPPGCFSALAQAYASFQYRLGSGTGFASLGHHVAGMTPLMMAILTSQHDGAGALIAAGARLDLRNVRGWTAQDFAKYQSVPPFLRSGLGGRPSECQAVTRLALTEEFEEEAYHPSYGLVNREAPPQGADAKISPIEDPVFEESF